MKSTECSTARFKAVVAKRGSFRGDVMFDNQTSLKESLQKIWAALDDVDFTLHVETVDENGALISEDILNNNDTLRFIVTKGLDVKISKGSVNVELISRPFDLYELTPVGFSQDIIHLTPEFEIVDFETAGTSPGPVTIFLPDITSLNGSKRYIIKDSARLAGAYNITILPSAGNTIASLTKYVLFSDGAEVTIVSDLKSNWVITGDQSQTGTTDPVLQSIAAAPTNIDEILYTTGSNTYSSTTITSFARDLIGSLDANSMRGLLGLAIGIDVQAYSTALENVSALVGNAAANQFMYTTGPGEIGMTDISNVAINLLGEDTTNGMRSALGLEVGSDVLSYNQGLQNFADLSKPTNTIIYSNGPGAWEVTSLTPFGRSLIGSTDHTMAQTLLKLEPNVDIQSHSPILEAMSMVESNPNQIIYQNNIGAGAVQTVASFGLSLLAINSSADAQIAIGVEPGVNVQTFDSDLESIAGKAISSDLMLYTIGPGVYSTVSTNTYGRALLSLASAAEARASLGLGSAATATGPGSGFGPLIGTTSFDTLQNKTLIDTSNQVRATHIGDTLGVYTLAILEGPGAPILGDILVADGNGNVSFKQPLGDVKGPVNSVDNSIVRFSGSTGKLIQGLSSVQLSDSGVLSGLAGLFSTSITGILQTSNQPNITNIGTLSGLVMNGDISFLGSQKVDGVHVSTLAPLQATASTLGALTVQELTQLSNINNSTISETQWSFLGNSDQQVATTNTPTFQGLVLTDLANFNAGGIVPAGQALTIMDPPVTGTHVPNKLYVDSVVASGSPPLEAAYASTTGPLLSTFNSGTLVAASSTTTLVIDGVVTTASDGKRYLIKNQTLALENGVYTRVADAAGPAWVLQRSIDFNNGVGAGTSIYVTDGTTNGNTGWSLQQAIDTIDTDPVIFVQLSGSQSLQAGAGMLQVGNSFNIQSADGNIIVNGDNIQFNTNYIGTASINTIGTITAGSWNGNIIPVSYGGTGVSTLNNLKSNMGLVIGTDIQAHDEKLDQISGLPIGPNQMVFTNGGGVFSATTLTPFCRSLLDDIDQPTARATLGLTPGIDVQSHNDSLQSLANLTTSSNQMVYTTAENTYAVTDITPFSRGLMSDPTSNAARTRLGLQIGSTVQAHSSMFDALAALSPISSDDMFFATGNNVFDVITTSSFGRGLLTEASISTLRTTLALRPNVDVQAYNSGLASIASLNISSNNLIYSTSSNTYATALLTPFARTLLDDVDAMAVRSTLGLGSAALQETPSGGLVGQTATQILSNKQIIGLSVLDGTKEAKFDISAIPSGSTQNFTVPPATDTLAGLNSTQTFKNKDLTDLSNNIRANQLGTTGVSVEIDVGPQPIVGDVLTALTPTTATWQTLPRPAGHVYVAKSGADYSSLGPALQDISSGLLPWGVPTATNQYIVTMLPGVYNEFNPIIIPSYVTVKSLATERSGGVMPVILTPASSSSASIIQLSSLCNITGIGVQGANGINGAGILAPSGTQNVQIQSCVAEDCSVGFKFTGSGVFGSTIVFAQNCFARGTPTTTVGTGFLCQNGAIMGGAVLACFGSPLGTFPNIGFHCIGATSQMALGTVQAQFVIDGFKADGGSNVQPALIRLTGGEVVNSLIGVDVGVHATIEMYGVSVTNSGLWDLRLTSSSSKFLGEGNKIRKDLISIVSNASFIGSSLSETPAEEALSIQGELHVGAIYNPSASDFGEGSDHVSGIHVFQSTNDTSFNDITNLVIPSGSSSPVFAGTSVGEMLYIGNSNNFKFPYIHIELDQGVTPKVNINTNLINLEYWNGSSWGTADMMSTQARAPYMAFATDGFAAGEYNYRFSPRPGWTQTTINGTAGYWIRFRIVGGGITTNPVVTLLKLGSNQTRIGEDGFVEYFGSAESFVRLPFDLNWLKPSGSQPSNQDTFISDSIGVGRSLNKYNAGEFRQAGFITELPEEIDTSHVLVLRFRYFTNNVNSGNILTRVVWGYNLDILDDPEQPGPLPSPSLSSVFPTTGAAPTSAAGDIGEILKTITISSGTNNRMMTIDYDLDICQLVPGRIGGSKTGDLLWVTFARLGNDAQDTYPGYMSFIQMTPYYKKWSEGAYDQY